MPSPIPSTAVIAVIHSPLRWENVAFSRTPSPQDSRTPPLSSFLYFLGGGRLIQQCSGLNSGLCAQGAHPAGFREARAASGGLARHLLYRFSGPTRLSERHVFALVLVTSHPIFPSIRLLGVTLPRPPALYWSPQESRILAVLVWRLYSVVLALSLVVNDRGSGERSAVCGLHLTRGTLSWPPACPGAIPECRARRKP